MYKATGTDFIYAKNGDVFWFSTNKGVYFFDSLISTHDIDKEMTVVYHSIMKFLGISSAKWFRSTSDLYTIVIKSKKGNLSALAQSSANKFLSFSIGINKFIPSGEIARYALASGNYSPTLDRQHVQQIGRTGADNLLYDIKDLQGRVKMTSDIFVYSYLWDLTNEAQKLFRKLEEGIENGVTLPYNRPYNIVLAKNPDGSHWVGLLFLGIDGNTPEVSEKIIKFFEECNAYEKPYPIQESMGVKNDNIRDSVNYYHEGVKIVEIFGDLGQ